MNRRTLERRIAAGEIPVHASGRIRGIRSVDVDRYVARRTSTPISSPSAGLPVERARFAQDLPTRGTSDGKLLQIAG